MEASRYFHDYYAILEIPPTADEALIKSSYRRLAKLRHPDKNPDKPNATADFQLLGDAYSTLTNKSKRRQYDARYYPSLSYQHGAAGHSTSNSYGWTHQSWQTYAPYAGPVPNYNVPVDPIAHCNATIDLYTRRVFELDGALNGLYANYSILSMQQITAQQDIEKTKMDIVDLKIAMKREQDAILNNYYMANSTQEATSSSGSPSSASGNKPTTTDSATYRSTPLSQAEFKALSDCLEKYHQSKRALESQLAEHKTTAHNLHKQITRVEQDMCVVRDQRTWAQYSLNTAMTEKKFWKTEAQAQKQARQQKKAAEAEVRAATMKNPQGGSASAYGKHMGADSKKRKENKEKEARWQAEEEEADRKVHEAWKQEALARDNKAAEEQKRREKMKQRSYQGKENRVPQQQKEQEALHQNLKQELKTEHEGGESSNAEASAATQRVKEEQVMVEKKEVEAQDVGLSQDPNNNSQEEA